MSSPEDFAPPSAQAMERLAAIVGAKHVITDAEAMRPYLREWRDKYVGRAACVLLPGSEEEVAAILKVADEERIAIVPQGGNTGLVGGQIPFEGGNEVVVSLKRLNRVINIDAVGGTMTLQAGVVLADAQEAARKAGFEFPIDLAAAGSCMVGGNLATNAGGLNVIAYGVARENCLALRAAIPAGALIGRLTALRKDNTGYDLRDLFIGSEGTLGIITSAVMKLHPAFNDTALAWVAVPSPEEAVRLIGFIRQRLEKSVLTAMELVCRTGVEFAVRHMGAREPFAEPAPWYVLVELSARGGPGSAMYDMEEILGAAFEEGLISDAALAQNAAQREEFWKLREGMSEAQKYEGGSIKSDISVPVAQIPVMIERGIAAVKEIVPGARPVPFGHLGDGNLHFNISQPEDWKKEDFLALWEEVTTAINEVALSLGGSISAEHGIGRMKRHWMERIHTAEEIAAMRAIKAHFDPNGIMNPGKLLPE